MIAFRRPRTWMWTGPLLVVAALGLELVFAMDDPAPLSVVPVLLVLVHGVLLVAALCLARRGIALVGLGAVMLSAIVFGLFAGFVWLPVTALLVMFGCLLALAMVGLERQEAPAAA